jgi:hypothetical protein
MAGMINAHNNHNLELLKLVNAFFIEELTKIVYIAEAQIKALL